MNPIGLHIGYWWGSGEENDIFRMLELTAQCGADIMELNPAWLLKLSRQDCAKLLREAQDRNIRLTLNGGLDAATDISADDPQTRRRGIQYCLEVLKKMPDLGMDLWSGVLYSAWLRRAASEGDFMAEKQRAKEYSIQSLREILNVAEQEGIDCCFEVCNRYEQFLFNTSREAVEFVNLVGSSRAKVHLDTFHMNIEEDNMLAAVAYAGVAGKLGHLHAGESNRRIPGVGATQIDWYGLGRSLRSVSYQGAVVIEPFVLTTAFNARRTCTWRNLCGGADVEKLVEDARTGCRFLRECLSGRSP